ncbi:hypothetical protein D3C72_2575350 [compost metagenome]
MVLPSPSGASTASNLEAEIRMMTVPFLTTSPQTEMASGLAIRAETLPSSVLKSTKPERWISVRPPAATLS